MWSKDWYFLDGVGIVVGAHACPVCETTVHHVYRAGRGRVYCTNACRQKAYRWRKRHGVRLCVERTGPTERLMNRRRHAMRDPRDPVAAIRDPHRREVAVCGAFATPVRHLRVTHTDFVPEFDWTCEACSALVGAGPYGSGVPEVVRALWLEQERVKASRRFPRLAEVA